MTTKFYEGPKFIKQKNLNIVPLVGDIITFNNHDYYMIFEKVFNFKEDCIDVYLKEVTKNT